MAGVSPEAVILSRIKQDHLTCHICQAPYLVPKALPCLHTFCAQCLQDYIFSRRYELEGRFPCPVCRVSAELPKGGVEGFPDNHLLVTLMDTVQEPITNPGVHHTSQPSTRDNTGDTVQTPVTNVVPNTPTGSLYPRLSPLLARHGMTSHQNPQRSEESDNRRGASHPGNRPALPSRPRPPRPSRPVLACTNNHSNMTSTSLPAGSAPLQRRLVLPVDSYPVHSVRGCHGAEVCFGQFGTGLTDFYKPVGLAVSPEGLIIVGDQKDNRILIFEPTGVIKTIFTCQGHIQDLTVSSRSLLYVANTQAKRSLVVCYNTRGHTIASFGNFFTFEKPHGVAITSNHHMVITSTDTHQVYTLNEYGKMTHKFVGKGKDGKRLNYPYHVTVSKKDKIIVADYGNDCIKVFDNTGKCKTQFGKSGSKQSQLNGPRGICTDTQDNIVVADSGNHRVQVFSSKGQFVRVAMDTKRDENSTGACPVNVAILQNSKLVVLLSGGCFAEVRIYPYRV